MCACGYATVATSDHCNSVGVEQHAAEHAPNAHYSGPVLALVAPGQGSQIPGMLDPWLEVPGAHELLARFSDAAGLDLLRLGTTASGDEIKDTAVTQPLLVAIGVLIAGGLTLNDGVVVAGHSVGEITAAAMAGSLSAEAAVAFAAHRGAEMAAACALTPTGMSAVLGGEAVDVLAVIEAARLTAANRNAAGQIVAAGALDALDALAADPPAHARVRPLAVAGAFHTPYMQPAETALAEYARGVQVRDPQLILLSNADGRPVREGAQVLGRLVSQVTRPVRWDLCQQTLGSLGVRTVIELAPAGALVGMAKRELPGVELLALKSPADLERAQSLIAGVSGEVGLGPGRIGQDGAQPGRRADAATATGGRLDATDGTSRAMEH